MDVVVLPTQRISNSQTSKAASSWVTARRKAPAFCRCGIGVEKRRGPIAMKDCWAPCVVHWHQAQTCFKKSRSLIKALRGALEKAPI